MINANDLGYILHILKKEPELAQALREALLGEELTNLPQRFAEHTGAVNQALENINARLEAQSPIPIHHVTKAITRYHTPDEIWSDSPHSECCSICNVALALHGCAGFCPLVLHQKGNIYQLTTHHPPGCDCDKTP